jgi:ABC-type sugar transport system ATPase subunit
MLYGMLRDAKKEGRSVVFITHRLKEIMEICDDVTVLRDGRVVGVRNMLDASLDQLAEMIIGKKQDLDAAGRAASGACNVDSAGTPCLQVRNLSQRERFKEISFHARRNEIVGVAGILGSGYNDILRCLGGVDARGRLGDILVDGRPVAFTTPNKLQRAGIGYLTNNREEEGLFHTMTVEENMFCGAYRHFRNRLGLIDRGKVRNDLADKVGILDIKLHSPTLLIDSLSGGNKQKIMVSRILNQKADILLFDEIAEGIDIEARNKLLRFIDEVVRRDKLLILASNIVEDLMTICDRILVVNHGSLYRSFNRDEFDEQKIYAAIQDLRPAE